MTRALGERGAHEGTAATSTRTIASSTSYREAEAAVDLLSDRGFPVERVAIVAGGVRLVEQVTGRRAYRRAALDGLVTGAAAGALFGFVAGILNWVDPLVAAISLAAYGLLVGGLIGTLFGAALHASTGGRRDFSSVGHIQADRYDVRVEKDVAGEAERLLAGPAR